MIATAYSIVIAREKERARYLARKARLHAAGVTSNGKPWVVRPALSFEQRLRSAAHRFWSKVTRGDGCWMWGTAVNRAGYGKFTVARKTIAAHRVAYLLERGAIPEGMLVCHTCDTPGCVNPAHLWLGTPADNMADKVAKGRQARGAALAAVSRPRNPARGLRCVQAKVTEADVRLIRELHTAGTPLREIGRRFGVCTQTAHAIARRRTWEHVA